MNREEFENRYGKWYQLQEVTQFKNHDRLRVYVPEYKLTLTFTLKKHFEDLPLNCLDDILVRFERGGG